MKTIGFGIVGTGMIASGMADAVDAADNAELVAVSSRTRAKAEAFVIGRPGARVVEGLAALLARDDVDAVYVGVPTAAKEAVALASLASGKHVLVDKPFVDGASVERMVDAARAGGLVFMDATHFVHHPRRAAIQAAMAERIGPPRVLHGVFYTGLDDRSNIRFDPALEPAGALGDLGWYCLRAVVTYLRPAGALARIEAAGRRDPATGALTQVTGLLAFESGENATFGAGFESGTMVNELTLVGAKGVIMMDDFVQNWTNSFDYQAADVPTGYTYRTGSMTPKDFTFVETPSERSQHVLMIENFARLALSGDHQAQAHHATATAITQRYLDAILAMIAN